MEEYDYVLHHIEGKPNVEADILSKNIYYIKGFNRSEDYWPILPEEIMKHVEKENSQQMSPEKREQLKKDINSIHEDLLHPDILKMKRTLGKYVKIPEINKMIYYTFTGCTKCNLEKDFQYNFAVNTNKVNVSNPNEIVSMDIIGLISNIYYEKEESENNFYILVIVDIYSRYT